MRQLIFAVLLLGRAAAAADAPLPVVPSVDLKRYAGLWYELARLPNRFERDCAADVTATYSLLPDGKISVLNRCRKGSGEWKEAKGTAKLADKKGPASKLRVTFFWPFYGDYWILALDPDYQWALVGEPGRHYLWVLSRSKRLDESRWSLLVARAKELGFDTSKLIRTAQAD